MLYLLLTMFVIFNNARPGGGTTGCAWFIHLKPSHYFRNDLPARAHGMWTYEPRQGRKAATVVCSVSAVVTLAFFNLRIAISDLRLAARRPGRNANPKLLNHRCLTKSSPANIVHNVSPTSLAKGTSRIRS